jgi:hypothetical protein
MTEEICGNKSLAVFLERFPAGRELDDVKTNNPAIHIYGRRFYKDQTPVEYLAEFLLVFASQKQENGEGCYRFNLGCDENVVPRYWPEDKLALKLFSFFPSSKLETRHSVHRQAYLDAIEAIKERIHGNKEEKEEIVRLIQSLFSGFVGVAKNRTWVTYSFLPAATSLLGRELVWTHADAKKDQYLNDWKGSARYFAGDRHIFMARGGELLYLQLVNLFNKLEYPDIAKLVWDNAYRHLQEYDLASLNYQLEQELQKMLRSLSTQIDCLVGWIDSALDEYKIDLKPKHANLGWVPSISRTEAFLFATEMNNICRSKIGTLDKLELMQTLCCFQVLRSLCFQARRFDDAEKTTEGFIGNYVWIVTDSETKLGVPVRQMAQNSFERVEGLLYRVLKNVPESDAKGSSTEAEKHGFQIFRKISKDIGLVIPQKGSGQRFTLHQGLIRFLVAALICPGERIRLNHFYQRVFAHYGLALGKDQLAVALNWCSNEADVESYSITANTAWIEEALQQGGFLVELSDAVSIVKNPG